MNRIKSKTAEIETTEIKECLYINSRDLTFSSIQPQRAKKNVKEKTVCILHFCSISWKMTRNVGQLLISTISNAIRTFAGSWASPRS